MPNPQKKSREEKASENFFSKANDAKFKTEKLVKNKPTRDQILRGTTEKQVKQNSPEIMIEKKETIKNSKKKIGKKIIKKRAKSTTTKNEVYIPPKIILKEKGYELIITEKPQAAMKIASALGVSTKQEFTKSVPYYEVDRKGKKIIVACAVGHLFTLKQNVPGSIVPIFDVSWVPNYLIKKGDFTKKYHDTILKLAKNAGSITVATDYDVEGEVIGTNVVRLICNQKDAQRMKFSTLTTKELNEAYEKKQNHINWKQAIAGESRHFLDWFYGINLSRALMNAIKTTGKFKIMSIGRVQGPTLKLIVDKEKEIKKFKPQPYWQIFATVEKPKVELKYTKDIFNEKELEKFENLIGEKGIAQTKKTEQKLPPNPPFNLTTLQTEAYKFYGITPANTLRAAQSLYLGGYISYPRTSSQKLPSSINYKSILETLKIRYKVSKLITKNKPKEGKKTDPAHPSIYPTGEKPPILSGDEEKIYDLIVKRFLALFCDDAIIDKKRISTKIKKFTFSANGSQTRKKAWLSFYPTKAKETEIPDLEGEITVTNQRIEQKETQPPKRYSPASILSELEKRNLGTKATRAAILDTLYDRGYIREKSIEATPLGISLINTLEKYSPIIIDEKLTKELQDKIDKIIELKNPEQKKLEEKEKEILNQAKNNIIKIAKDFEKNEKKIGNELMNAQEKQREIERKENLLNKCPKCKEGNLRITYSPKNKKFFISCTNYPKCTNTYSLPPYGIIKKLGKNCEKCGFPLLMAIQKGKKPWIFCFNPECETNKERIKAYKKKMIKKQNN
jgi:DNA topoisomerase-1